MRGHIVTEKRYPGDVLLYCCVNRVKDLSQAIYCHNSDKYTLRLVNIGDIQAELAMIHATMHVKARCMALILKENPLRRRPVVDTLCTFVADIQRREDNETNFVVLPPLERFSIWCAVLYS